MPAISAISGSVELLDRLAEVNLRRRADAVRALAEKHLVQIQREDLLLGELLLDAQRREDLEQLAAIALLRAQEDAARELHRDRAAAFGFLARQQVARDRADQARIVDAAVLEEAVVLRGEHRVDHLVRDRVERERDAPLLAELRDQLAVAAVDAQRHLQPDVLDGRDIGQ